MMKQLFSVLAVLVFMLTMSVTAFAENFSYNYQFNSGSDYRETLGNPTTTDTVQVNHEQDNVRRNKDAALNPPPFGAFSGEFATGQSNIYITLDAVDYAYNTTIPLNLPTYDTLGYGVNGVQSGNYADGTSTAANGGMLPSTSIMGDSVVNTNANVNNGSADTPALPMIQTPSGNITYTDITQQTGQHTQLTPSADGSIGKLTISKIKLSAKVFEGETLANLENGVGKFYSTSGWDGNVALAGHNNGYFKDIKNLRNGDEVVFETQYGRRVYQVVSKDVVEYTDYSRLQFSYENKLTLITCVSGSPTQRLVVTAVEKK